MARNGNGNRNNNSNNNNNNNNGGNKKNNNNNRANNNKNKKQHSNGKNGNHNQNQKNGKKNKNNGNRDQHDNDDNRHDGLPKHEKDQLARTAKLLWKDGLNVDDIVHHCLEEDPSKCPPKLRFVQDKERRLAEIISRILQDDHLVNFKGRPLPSTWPESLQANMAELYLKQDMRPDQIRDALKGTDEFKATFTGNKPSWDGIASAIGHFLMINETQLDSIIAGNYIPGFDDVDDDPSSSLETPDGWTLSETNELLESLTREKWAKDLFNSRKDSYDPNYVNNGWSYQGPAPVFGAPSHLVIRQADPYDPNAPDPLPDPVRPVANAPFHPRKCQGTHGCSRHCTWNRDFHRGDGWSQHNFNNKYGISMYYQELTDETVFEDADGDVLMANNFPPWITQDQDGNWQGQRVNWTKCLASDDQANHGWVGSPMSTR